MHSTGGAIATATQIRAKVVAIDAIARTATIETDAGKRRTLPVRPDIDLARHKIGDQVVMRVTRAVALAVKAPEPAAK